jgi:hypothetical protein
MSITWFYFLTNCCEICLNDSLDISAFFKAEIIFELEKLRFMNLFDD